MRIWHYALLPYLSKLQFDGQLRELVAIKRDWETKGTTNHLLINSVMQYPKSELTFYFQRYDFEYWKRYNKHLPLKYHEEFLNFSANSKVLLSQISNSLFDGWHNKEYLRVCMANLYEKYHFGVGKSKITQEEWDRVLQGYKEITGEDWKL